MNINDKYSKIILLILLFFTFVLAATVLKVTSTVAIPLIIAILISLVFEPIIAKLNEKFKIPWILGIFLIITITAIVIFLLGSLIIASLRKVIEVYPKYEERFIYVYENLAKFFNLSYDKNNTLFENLWGQLGIRNIVQSMAITLSSGAIKFIKDFLMVCLFAVFLLIEMKIFREKLEFAFKSSSKGRIGPMISDIISQVSRYISVKFYVSLLTGIIVWLGCIIIGVDFPIVHAFLSFISNFIPTFGSIFSSVLTCLFALLQFWPKPLPVIATIILMVGVNMIIGNILEPRIQGKNLGLSPFVIISSLSIWGWIWGFVGMIIAVPLMVILKIICENISILKPVSIILGNKVPVEKNKLNE